MPEQETDLVPAPQPDPRLLALAHRLSAEILESPSATLTLEKWCRSRRDAESPPITARLIGSGGKPAGPRQRARLKAEGDEAVLYRRVYLECGPHILLEAENWYVPGRLTPEMNHALAHSDTPFGKVVRGLDPYRQTFMTSIFSPLAEPDALFEHRAILYTAGHEPFSEVHEVYKRKILEFLRPDAEGGMTEGSGPVRDLEPL